MGDLHYQNKRSWILLNVFLCLPEPPVELLSSELEWKEDSQTGNYGMPSGKPAILKMLWTEA